MRTIKRFGTVMIVAAIFAACAASRPAPVTQLGVGDGGVGHEALKSGGQSLNDAVEQFVTRGTHHTVTRIDDVTDPEHPQKVYEVAGNLLGSCGVRNLFASALGLTTMGAASGGGETLGTYCAGLCGGSGAQRVPSTYNNHSRVVIGAGSTSTCTAAATPWACCTGSGTGCAISNLDVALFAMGQPNGSLTGVQTNYAAWYSGGAPNVFDPGSAYVDSAPVLYWNGTNLQGVQFVQTYSSGQANQQWCEYGVWSENIANAGALSNGGVCQRGWQLNHAVISPCLTKSSGQTFTITVTITLA